MIQDGRGGFEIAFIVSAIGSIGIGILACYVPSINADSTHSDESLLS